MVMGVRDGTPAMPGIRSPGVVNQSSPPPTMAVSSGASLGATSASPSNTAKMVSSWVES